MLPPPPPTPHAVHSKEEEEGGRLSVSCALVGLERFVKPEHNTCSPCLRPPFSALFHFLPPHSLAASPSDRLARFVRRHPCAHGGFLPRPHTHAPCHRACVFITLCACVLRITTPNYHRNRLATCRHSHNRYNPRKENERREGKTGMRLLRYACVQWPPPPATVHILPSPLPCSSACVAMKQQCPLFSSAPRPFFRVTTTNNTPAS